MPTTSAATAGSAVTGSSDTSTGIWPGPHADAAGPDPEAAGSPATVPPATVPPAADTAPAAGRSSRLHRLPGRVFALCAGIFLVALGLRLFHVVTSYDLFIDEVTYAEIARNIAQGHGVTHYGEPFDLHPPVVLGTFAAALRLIGTGGSLADLAFALRPVPALFGAGTTVLTFLIARRCGVRTGWAAGAAALIALDPFQISYDSRVMLEAQTQFFAAATVLLVIRSARPGPVGAHRLLLCAAGVCAGLVFCSKETFGLVLGAALVVLVLHGRAVPRRALATVLAIGLGGYLVNLVLTIWLGGVDAWLAARGNGLTRLIGLNKETGFTSDTVQVSMLSRITANLDQLAVTYTLLILGGLCCLTLVYRLVSRRSVRLVDPVPTSEPVTFAEQHDRPGQHEPDGRDEPAATIGTGIAVVTAWALTSGGYLFYATAFGSIEEQMYYIPLLPCVLCLIVLAGRRRPSGGRWPRRIWGALIAVLIAVDLVVWARVHTIDNNMYRQFFAWAATGLPAGSRVAVTEDSAQFVLDDVDLGTWHTIAQLRRNRVDYVLINPSLVEQGYGVGDPAFLTALTERTPVVFSASSNLDGQLLVFDVRSITGGTR